MGPMTEARSTEIIRDYVDINGVSTYYEVEGRGEPLVLLHGGLCAIETYAPIRPGLAGEFRLFLPERRGHGRTADVEGPWSLGQLAADTIAFIEKVVGAPVSLAGWSSGGMVALYVAMTRPDLISKLVVIEATANHAGDPPEVADLVAHLDHMPPDFLPLRLRQLYGAVSPDGPEHFDVVAEKQWQMMKVEPAIDLPDLAVCAAPALIVVSDHGMVTPQHARDLASAFPSGEVVTVPDSNHALPLEKPQEVVALIQQFLSSR